MKLLNSKYLIWIILSILLFQSCKEDDDNFPPQTLLNESSDLVLTWTDIFLELDRYATGMRPTSTARSLAYIHLAAYEAGSRGSDNMISCDQFLRRLHLDEDLFQNEMSYQIAINKAYAEAMDYFLFNIPDDLRAQIAILEQENFDQLSAGLSSEEIQASLEWGTYVAEHIIHYSNTDVTILSQLDNPQPTSYTPPRGDGFWTYAAEPERALFPYWGDARSFVIGRDEVTTIAPPITYSEESESPYYAQMMEVLTANNEAREAEGEQLWIAEFWSDDVEGLMMSPPGRQFSISNQLIEQFNLSLEEALILNVKLGFSLNDAAVATWYYKYQYMVMRPSNYIHEFIDPDYQTNLFKFISWPNPSFPGYPSGHSTFASAAAGVFIDFFGDEVNFIDRSHEGRTEFESEPRSYIKLSDMAYENAYSRIPLGVHIRMDCDEGLRLGYEIADAVNNFRLTRE